MDTLVAGLLAAAILAWDWLSAPVGYAFRSDSLGLRHLAVTAPLYRALLLVAALAGIAWGLVELWAVRRRE